MSEGINVKIAMRNTITGNIGLTNVYFDFYGKEAEEAFSTIRYMWTDGNYSCDCNREIYCPSYGVEPQSQEDEDGAWSRCTDGEFVVDFMINADTDELLMKDNKWVGEA